MISSVRLGAPPSMTSSRTNKRDTRIALRRGRGMAGAGRTLHVLRWRNRAHRHAVVICEASDRRSGCAGERAVLGGLQVGGAAGRRWHADSVHRRSGQSVRGAVVVQGRSHDGGTDHAARVWTAPSRATCSRSRQRTRASRSRRPSTRPTARSWSRSNAQGCIRCRARRARWRPPHTRYQERGRPSWHEFHP